MTTPMNESNTSTESRRRITANGMTWVRITDTRIPMAGVLRCCLDTVATEFVFPDKREVWVRVGATSRCQHCNSEFRLMEADPCPLWIYDSSNQHPPMSEEDAENFDDIYSGVVAPPEQNQSSGWQTGGSPYSKHDDDDQQ